jgi:hypothetical protein
MARSSTAQARTDRLHRLDSVHRRPIHTAAVDRALIRRLRKSNSRADMVEVVIRLREMVLQVRLAVCRGQCRQIRTRLSQGQVLAGVHMARIYHCSCLLPVSMAVFADIRMVDHRVNTMVMQRLVHLAMALLQRREARALQSLDGSLKTDCRFCIMVSLRFRFLCREFLANKLSQRAPCTCIKLK